MEYEFRGSVIKQVESIIQEAVSSAVSDIHIEP